MEYLWAPWRIEYIRRDKSQDEGCIFCKKNSEENDEDNLIVYRGETAFVLMNLFPYNNGHLMIAPYRHTSDILSLSEDESHEIFELTMLSICVINTCLKPQGYNIGMNLGHVSGAGIADHLHQHIVPRWLGDTNFMPIVGHTKVMMNGLKETWKVLHDAFEEIKINQKHLNDKVTF
ncbi:MAG: HIT domain-containing protein [Candidatus Marinimicrobia bacterium]|nr:HIT domain-containing protein [Candidatus Neomarinimicrobiota bacterium]MDD5581949.1 HIT domain-containing protein [Candidatus Neomarinimicrobiota bacterium]